MMKLNKKKLTLWLDHQKRLSTQENHPQLTSETLSTPQPLSTAKYLCITHMKKVFIMQKY